MVPFFFCRDILWLSHFSGSLSTLVLFLHTHAIKKRKISQNCQLWQELEQIPRMERVHTSSQRSIIWRKWAGAWLHWPAAPAHETYLKCEARNVIRWGSCRHHHHHHTSDQQASARAGRCTQYFVVIFKYLLVSSASLALLHRSLFKGSFKDLF